MNPLLEKAKKHNLVRTHDIQFDPQVFEVIVSWLKKEISITQLSAGVGLRGSGGAAHHLIVKYFRAAYEKGLITIKI